MADITLSDLGIRFDLDRQVRPVTPALTRVRRRCSTSWAMRGVNLTIEPGEGIALVGANGAGKSTLLRVMAGVLEPDEGSLRINGRVGSLLSTGGGLMTSLTGRENALLLGVLAGLSRAQARATLTAIMERSELGEAFERPVSTYSQGMQARLGFAVIENVAPNILLLDEVHEAIDQTFRIKLEARARQIRQDGGIVVAAGHDREMLARLCDRVCVVDKDEGPHLVDDLDVLDGYLATQGAAV